jgi:hypothetical protein
MTPTMYMPAVAIATVVPEARTAPEVRSGVVGGADAQGCDAFLVDLEEVRCEFGAGTEAAAERAVDDDPGDQELLSCWGAGLGAIRAPGPTRVGRTRARQAVANVTAPTAPR